MKDLVEFQYNRIEALTKKVLQYEQYILELCDKDCPEDYKRIIKKEILG